MHSLKKGLIDCQFSQKPDYHLFKVKITFVIYSLETIPCCGLSTHLKFWNPRLVDFESFDILYFQLYITDIIRKPIICDPASQKHQQQKCQMYGFLGKDRF